MQDKNAGLDLRVQRTRQSIRNALLELVNETDFESITIQQIADKAMINRVTFYKHYQDKYDLMERMMRDMMEGMSASVERLLKEPSDELVYKAFTSWLKEIGKNQSFYRLVLGKQANAIFAAHLLIYLEEKVTQIHYQIYQNNNPTLQDVIGLRFITSGFLGVSEWWLSQKKPPPEEEVAALIHDIIKNIMR